MWKMVILKNDKKEEPEKKAHAQNSRHKRKIEFVGKTHRGRVRKNNEDFFGCKLPESKELKTAYGSIFVVADGVGGNANGEVASQLAVSVITNAYYTMPVSLTPEARLAKAFEKANQVVRTKAKEMHTPEMATTVCAAVVLSDRVVIANIGDSRCYVLNPDRSKKITQVTHDHSLVAEQVREGLITPQQAKMAKNKNVITRAMGTEATIKVDFFNLPIAPGDKLLLTTDGLLRVFNDEQIYQIVQQPSVLNPVDNLISLANKGGAPDNVTACLIDLDKKVSFVKRNPLAIGITAFAVLAILVGYLIFIPPLIRKTEPYKVVSQAITAMVAEQDDKANNRLNLALPRDLFMISDAFILRKSINNNPGPNEPMNISFEIKPSDDESMLGHVLFFINKKPTTSVDFELGQSYDLVLEPKKQNKYYEPVVLTLHYQSHQNWEIEALRIGGLDQRFLLEKLQNHILQKAEKTSNLVLPPADNNDFWQEVVYLKIFAVDANEVRLDASDMPDASFEDNQLQESKREEVKKGYTDYKKTDRRDLEMLNQSFPLQLTCKVTYANNYTFYFEMSYHGEKDHKYHWSIVGAENNQGDQTLSKSDKNYNYTLTLEHNNANKKFPQISIKRTGSPTKLTEEKKEQAKELRIIQDSTTAGSEQQIEIVKNSAKQSLETSLSRLDFAGNKVDLKQTVPGEITISKKKYQITVETNNKLDGLGIRFVSNNDDIKDYVLLPKLDKLNTYFAEINEIPFFKEKMSYDVYITHQDKKKGIAKITIDYLIKFIEFYPEKTEVFINGEIKNLYVETEIKTETFFVPVAFFTYIDLVVTLNETEAIITKSNLKLVFEVNNKIFFINNSKKELKEAPFFKNNYLMVPAGIVFEELKAKVEWDSKEKKITITYHPFKDLRNDQGGQ